MAGVCGGVAEFVGARPRTVRVVYLLTVPPSLGFTLVGYLLLWALIPPASASLASAQGSAPSRAGGGSGHPSG